jgi:DNA polymerase III epsilon subunit-like protein
VAAEVVEGYAGADVYISVDVEADGSVPLVHSLLSLGACVAGTFDGKVFRRVDPLGCTFYAELRPVSDEFDPAALAVAGLDRDRLAAEGEDPAVAMQRFAAWLQEAARGGRPVFVAYPASFDWPWVAAYLGRYAAGAAPFGFSSVLDMKTMYLVKAGVRIGKAVKGAMPKELLSARPHTHHALDDAVEQAELFANLWEWPGPVRG